MSYCRILIFLLTALINGEAGITFNPSFSYLKNKEFKTTKLGTPRWAFKKNDNMLEDFY
jgi:hypothetical protein